MKSTRGRLMFAVSRLGRFGTLLGFALLASGPAGHSQDMPVPVDVQFSILSKILAFDRTLVRKGKTEVVVGILFQNRFRPSVIAKDQFLAAQEGSAAVTVDGMPIRCLAINIDDGDGPLESAPFTDLDALYVAPLRAVSLDAVTALSRAEGIVTLTGVPEYLEQGLAIAIGAKEERPVIIINLPAARGEGAEFSSQLMRVARVVQ
jgi:hypothetical protein